LTIREVKSISLLIASVYSPVTPTTLPSGGCNGKEFPEGAHWMAPGDSKIPLEPFLSAFLKILFREIN
jgi:hypothetical protein